MLVPSFSPPSKHRSDTMAVENLNTMLAGNTANNRLLFGGSPDADMSASMSSLMTWPPSNVLSTQMVPPMFAGISSSSAHPPTGSLSPGLSPSPAKAARLNIDLLGDTQADPYQLFPVVPTGTMSGVVSEGTFTPPQSEGVLAPPTPPLPYTEGSAGEMLHFMKSIHESLHHNAVYQTYHTKELKSLSGGLMHLNEKSTKVMQRLDSIQKDLKEDIQQVEANCKVSISSIESRLEALEKPGASNRAQSLPAQSRRIGQSTGFIEAKVLTWPNRTRSEAAHAYIKNVCALPSLVDIPCTIIPAKGSYCSVVIIRFEGLEDRKIWLSSIKEGSIPPFNFDGGSKQLVFKTVVPRDIAEQTDVLSSSVWYCHKALSGINDIRNQSVEAELLANYKDRELCLYDCPIACYVDTEGNQILGRSGGSFCILGSALSELGQKHGFQFDIPKWATHLSTQFKGRQIIVK